ncbi:hypothetical protein [Devosia nitrariae]|uniref:Phage P22-like portal protein n=1 Tax=Devosia nitrariae TaxID=2071872 RepID=A0ABQ5W1L7_9HYPH|nr:hypothetical protein [Devosia nitrariae]GLQ53764.1 hypothetical protein GCM10010862_10230 [Devosia nitrariae]
MAQLHDLEPVDSLKDPGEPKSAARILAAIRQAEQAFLDYQDVCDRIDRVYARKDDYRSGEWTDPDYDLFWASMEILKPAVYAHAPQPVVTPQFKDRRRLQNLTAEILERGTTVALLRAGIDEVMTGVRDDLIFYNRGQMWVTLEDGRDGRRISIEHLDRKDFLHEPARKWADVGWVARRAWMTREEMRKRFAAHSGEAFKHASTSVRREDQALGGADGSRKAGVWEVWHKRDNRVYWVAPDAPFILDEGEPHLELDGFFPCPRPAFGTLRARSLMPVPDYLRYASHFSKINQLTARLYLLLDRVKMKGLIPAGGDIGTAVEQALHSDDDELLIPVPAAAMMESSGNFVVWLPLKDIADAIQGLIGARGQLFNDFYQLSGISDIMRGASQAQETLGAQQLKSQYGSVRVRGKIDELQRIACDVTKISAEIMAEAFGPELLLEMAQMELPRKAELERRAKAIEDAAEKEMEAIGRQAKAMAEAAKAQDQEIEPAAAEQQLQAAQQQIISKYAVQLRQIAEAVPIEDMMTLLRDNRARGFAFEIATDSTILTDEIAEKASRNEFLTAFTGAAQGLMSFASLGQEGAKMAGEVLRFVLAPYRAGRTLNAVIDEFVDAAPQLAAAQAGSSGLSEAEQSMSAANQKMADAELRKSEAAIAKVQADTAKTQQEMQFKVAEAQTKAQQEGQRLQLEMAETRGNLAEQARRIEKIGADIQLAFARLGIERRAEQRADVKTAAEVVGETHRNLTNPDVIPAKAGIQL